MLENSIRIEFEDCCESLDLLDDQDELEKVVAWILMMNRLTGDDRAAPVIGSNAEHSSLQIDIACGDAGCDERNARNAVADLLGLFDPADHRVLQIRRDGADTGTAQMPLWPVTSGSPGVTTQRDHPATHAR